MGDDKTRSPFYIHAALGHLVFLTGQKLEKKVN